MKTNTNVDVSEVLELLDVVEVPVLDVVVVLELLDVGG